MSELDRQLPELLAKFNQQPASPKPSEEWIEYGLRWDGVNPSGGDDGGVTVWEDSRPESPFGMGDVQSSSQDWAEDGYPNTIVQRKVVAQEWKEIPE